MKQHPKYPQVTVDDEGNVYGFGELAEIRAGIYLHVDILGVEETLVHRLVCAAHHGLPTQERPLVNHKDGNKYNHHPSNLEWCSYSENHKHAYRAGLRPDNVFILLKDIESEKVTSFYSLQNTARFLNCNGEKVHRYLKSRRDAPFLGRYDLKTVKLDFIGFTKKDLNKVGNGKGKLVKLKKGNEIIIYPSASEAASFLNVKPAKVHYQLRRPLEKRLEINGYSLEWYMGDKPPIKSTFKPKPPVRKPKKCRVINVVTGSVKFYDSVEEFANEYGWKKGSIQKATWDDRIWQDFKVEYVSI